MFPVMLQSLMFPVMLQPLMFPVMLPLMFLAFLLELVAVAAMPRKINQKKPSVAANQLVDCGYQGAERLDRLLAWVTLSFSVIACLAKPSLIAAGLLKTTWVFDL